MLVKLVRRMAYVCLVFGMVVLTGCGGTVTVHEEFYLAEDVTIPAAPELDEELSEGGYGNVIEWLGTGGPVLIGEVCGLSELAALADNDLSSLLGEVEDLPFYFRLLARRVKVESITVKNITLRARQGNFNFLRELGCVVRSTTTNEPLLVAKATEVSGQEVELRILPEEYDLLDMIDKLRVTDCIESYLNLEGSLPSEDVVFGAVAKFKLVLRIR